jgi:hypothetical protein
LAARGALVVAGTVLLSAAVGCHSGNNPSASSTTPAAGSSIVQPADAGPYVSSPDGTAPLRSITGMVDGWNVISPAADRYTSDDNALLHDFGQDVTMAFGAKGAPVVIWASLTDPPNNGYTISSANLGPDGKWQAPVDVARTRLAPGPTGSVLSAAGDASTNVVAVVTERRDDNSVATGIDLYLSADDGASWVKTGITDAEAYRPTIALSGSNLFVAYQGTTGDVLTTSVLPPVKHDAKNALDGADLRTMTWSTQNVPAPEGAAAPLGTPTVAVDRDGHPGLVGEFAEAASNRRVVAFWHPGMDRPSAVTETDATAGTLDVVDLVYRGNDPIASVSRPAPTNGEVAEVGISPDGGRTFLPAVPVPTRNGERASFGVTMAIAAPPGAAGTDDTGTTDTTAADTAPPDTSASAAAPTIGLAYLPDVQAPVDDPDGCGLPRLAMSTNLTDWRTCGPTDDNRRDPRSAVQPANLFQAVVAGPDGALYLPVTNRNPEGTLPAGIVVWRQPTSSP